MVTRLRAYITFPDQELGGTVTFDVLPGIGGVPDVSAFEIGTVTFAVPGS